MPQGSVHWQGTQRRAYGPSAHWNVQVVRGKVTTRCLWHACKALGVGLLLMLLGACMATIGYYADQLSVAQEIRGNLTVKVKNESRGFHLNNLSYAGPIVMGVGGFIVVAACVMTFEARDSAAKVVPARFRFQQNATLKVTKTPKNRRSTSCQTMKWDHQLGLFRVNRSPSPSTHEVSRKQLTAELMQFSKNLQNKNTSRPLKRSPSAPNLIEKKSPRRRSQKTAGCTLLNPGLLQRHALSVDNPGYNPLVSGESLEKQQISGSQVSMAMDLHIPNKGPVTLKVKDRSDTARRHQLLRQTKVDDEGLEIRRGSQSCSPKLPNYCKYPDDFVPRNRNSVDLRLLGDLDLGKSPRDFRKVSSPNFRKMSLDRIGGERRLNKSLENRKVSLDFKRSPEFGRGDYRKYSIERFTADCARYLGDIGVRSRANSGESGRRQKYPRLYHSRSDDNRRRSFDRNRRDSQASRFSLNTQAVMETCDLQYELKYFTPRSLDTEENRGDNSDDSHVVDAEETTTMVMASEELTETEALLEEPELENLTEAEVNGSDDVLVRTTRIGDERKEFRQISEMMDDSVKTVNLVDSNLVTVAAESLVSLHSLVDIEIGNAESQVPKGRNLNDRENTVLKIDKE